MAIAPRTEAEAAVVLVWGKFHGVLVKVLSNLYRGLLGGRTAWTARRSIRALYTFTVHLVQKITEVDDDSSLLFGARPLKHAYFEFGEYRL